ncbi:MAG TPA: hypothetical protein VMU22_03005 [Rhizomicrobium sp.]|nr:hypothetical protein [Rhizomicrobium sp.]
MSLKQKLLIAVMGAGLALAGAGAASAGTWQNDHPRRVEVNHRLAKQDMRIDKNLREGKISPREAMRLHRQDHMIRREERREAAFKHGHITRLQQARLNHQENRVGGKIYRDAH